MKCPNCGKENKPDGMCTSSRTYSFGCSCGAVWITDWSYNMKPLRMKKET